MEQGSGSPTSPHGRGPPSLASPTSSMGNFHLDPNVNGSWSSSPWPTPTSPGLHFGVTARSTSNSPSPERQRGSPAASPERKESPAPPAPVRMEIGGPALHAHTGGVSIPLGSNVHGQEARPSLEIHEPRAESPMQSPLSPSGGYLTSPKSGGRSMEQRSPGEYRVVAAGPNPNLSPNPNLNWPAGRRAPTLVGSPHEGVHGIVGFRKEATLANREVGSHTALGPKTTARAPSRPQVCCTLPPSQHSLQTPQHALPSWLLSTPRSGVENH